MIKQYAVIGNPIEHSLSPQIHRAFATQLGIDIQYRKLLAPLDGFATLVKNLRQQGLHGLNVTLPFKMEAYALATQRSPQADMAQAVNTLTLHPEAIQGDNTDGIGLITDITRNLDFEITDKRVLLMGAGGAACGVVYPLLEQQPAQLVIANRSLDKAKRALARFADKITVSSYEALANLSFDLVINATSSGLDNDMPPLPDHIFLPHGLGYDMVYGRETPFMRFVCKQGARTTDGLGMLVEQAAAAFMLWHGLSPDTAPVMAQLRTTCPH